jgi:cytochrome c peroxidase
VRGRAQAHGNRSRIAILARELKALRPKNIPELATYVRDRRAAIALGKALFWDMQVGSDGIQACGSCHFRAGADPRSINQANPGGANNPDPTVNVGINHQLRAADFPLHQLADPTSRISRVLRDNDDVISSQGVKLSRFGERCRARTGTSRSRFPTSPK